MSSTRPNLFQRGMRQMGRTRWWAWLGSRTAPAIDRSVARLTGGRRTMANALLPTLLLTTVGRRTGKERVVPLGYLQLERAYAVAATNWGQGHHPAWSANLLANPEARVTVRGRQQPVRARLADDGEQSVLWPRFIEMWPAYSNYLERTDRTVRLFILQPIEAGAAEPSG